MKRANYLTCSRYVQVRIAASESLSNPEICDLDDAPVVNHYVGRLDIAMDDAFAMGIIERACGLFEVINRCIRMDFPCVLQNIGQRMAGDQLHRDKSPIALVAI